MLKINIIYWIVFYVFVFVLAFNNMIFFLILFLTLDCFENYDS